MIGTIAFSLQDHVSGRHIVVGSVGGDCRSQHGIVGLLGASARPYRGSMSPEAYSARRLQLLVSAGYVFGCAFRSFLPVFDVPRVTLVDSWLSSAMVGRSVATVAELCFAIQWA